MCAATHPEMPGDRYLDDGIHYRLSVELGLLVTEPMHADSRNPGRGGHEVHGEWWWFDRVPPDVVIEQPAASHRCHEVGSAPVPV